MTIEYRQLKIVQGNTTELNELAKEGWSVVPGSIAHGHVCIIVLLQREEPARRGRKPAVGPEETK